MLQLRIATALALLAVLIPAMLVDASWPFTGLTLLMITAATWEWARLNGLQGKAAIACGLAGLGLCLCLGHWLAGATPQSLAWVLLGAGLLRVGVSGWSCVPRFWRLAVGVLLLSMSWLALVQARRMGVNFLLSVMVLVWAADVFAYFVGRAFGRHKLAPTISPGKSWEGVWGGLFGVLLVALVWCQADQRWHFDPPSLYSHLLARGWLLFLISLVFLGAMSVVGDLVESLIKRHAGMKDSSQLLPGHGGVLDRIDALLPTLPLAMMLLTF
jgi:phosphatidate cytidylyltransferase